MSDPAGSKSVAPDDSSGDHETTQAPTSRQGIRPDPSTLLAVGACYLQENVTENRPPGLPSSPATHLQENLTDSMPLGLPSVQIVRLLSVKTAISQPPTSPTSNLLDSKQVPHARVSRCVKVRRDPKDKPSKRSFRSNEIILLRTDKELTRPNSVTHLRGIKDLRSIELKPENITYLRSSKELGNVQLRSDMSDLENIKDFNNGDSKPDGLMTHHQSFKDFSRYIKSRPDYFRHVENVKYINNTPLKQNGGTHSEVASDLASTDLTSPEDILKVSWPTSRQRKVRCVAESCSGNTDLEMVHEGMRETYEGDTRGRATPIDPDMYQNTMYDNTLLIPDKEQDEEEVKEEEEKENEKYNYSERNDNVNLDVDYFQDEWNELQKNDLDLWQINNTSMKTEDSVKVELKLDDEFPIRIDPPPPDPDPVLSRRVDLEQRLGPEGSEYPSSFVGLRPMQGYVKYVNRQQEYDMGDDGGDDGDVEENMIAAMSNADVSIESDV